MSSCKAIRERLAEAGAEAVDELPEVKRHLEGCAACSGFLADLRRIEAALEDLPPHDAPDALVAATLRAVRHAANEHPVPERPANGQRYLAVGLAASVVIAAGLALTMSFPETSNDFFVANRQPVVPGDDRHGSRDRLARGPVAKETPLSSQRVSELVDGEVAAQPKGGYARPDSAMVGGSLSGDISETFETAQLGSKKAKQDAYRIQQEDQRQAGEQRAGEERAFGLADQDFSDEGLQRELDVIALLETPFFEKQRSVRRSQERLELETEPAPIAEPEVRSGPAATIKSRASNSDQQGLSGTGRIAADLRANEPQARLRADNETDDDKNAPAMAPEQEAGADIPMAAPTVIDEFGKTESSLRSVDALEDSVPPPYENKRQKVVAPADSGQAQLLASRFLDDYRALEPLSFQEASGYWANTYLPGDPAMRLLQARLRAWDRSALGKDAQLEQGVRQVHQSFDPPRDAAMAVYLQADRAAIDGPTRLRVLVGLKGAERQGGHRPAMNIALLVDLRGNTDAGSAARIRALIAALERARLPGDRLSLTLAGPGGGLLVPPADFRHGPLRVAMERMFGNAVEAISTDVDLHQAFKLASESVLEGDDPGATLGSSLVLLVTGSSLADDLATLEQMAHRNAVGGVALSVVSLAGRERLEQIDRLVAAGQGNRRILDSADAAEGLIDRELHAASRAIARALRLRIRLAPGVKLVDVLGSRRLQEPLAQRVREAEGAIDRRLARNLGIRADRGEDEEGIQIVIPSFQAGNSHTILLDLVASGPGPLADVTLRYKDVVHLKNGVARANLTIGSGQSADGPGELNVLKNLVAWEFARQTRQAGRTLSQGDARQTARRLTSLRDLIHGLRQEVTAWQSDPDLIADEVMLDRYLAVLARPAADDPAQRQYLADSLRFAAFRKMQTAAR